MPNDELFQAICEAITEDGLKPREERRGLVPAMLDAVQPTLERLETERDGAYQERARLLAWLATLYPSATTPATDVDEPGWLLLYLTTPAGQLSWHIHPRDAHHFWHIEHLTAGHPRVRWDGHTTEQKYERIRQLTTSVSETDDRTMMQGTTGPGA